MTDCAIHQVNSLIQTIHFKNIAQICRFGREPATNDLATQHHSGA